MRHERDTTLIGGLTCSVGLHALLGFAFALWGDAPRTAAPPSDEVLVTYLPPMEESVPPTPPPPPPPVPEAQPEPPPPLPPDPTLRLGIDDALSDSPAWLGFREATEHSAPKADIDQSAMEREPGDPGPAGLPGTAAAPSPSTPPAAAPAANPQPESTVREPGRSPPAATPPPQPGADRADPDIPDRLPSQGTDVPPPPEQAQPGETQPESTQPDPAAPPAAAPEGEPQLPGEALPDGPDLQAGDRHDREAGEIRPPEQAPLPGVQSTHQVEVGPLPEGVERPTEPAPATEPPPELREVIGPPVPENLLPVDPEAERLTEQPDAEASAPPESAESPPLPAQAPTPPASGAGGQDARPGERSDREADASSTKPILVRAVAGRVAAGPGVMVQTTRPQWSTTTLLTTTPKNPVVRVTFGRSGKVIEAGFVNGQGTGYDNVDEPLLNAVHSWRASGKKIRELPADDPKAGLTIVFSITLR